MEFIHEGLLCRRVLGAHLGRRGHAKKNYGWIILSADGEELDILVPTVDGGVPAGLVRHRASQLRRMIELGLDPKNPSAPPQARSQVPAEVPAEGLPSTSDLDDPLARPVKIF